MRKTQIKIVLIVLVIIAIIATATVIIVSRNMASDPYVTKSYVEKTVKNNVLKEATEEIANEAKTIENSFLNTINSKDGSYRSIEMTDGQSIKLAANAEILVISGKVTFAEGGSLSDISSGKALTTKNDLTINHSYIANEDGEELTVSGDTVLLIRGTAIVNDSET